MPRAPRESRLCNESARMTNQGARCRARRARRWGRSRADGNGLITWSRVGARRASPAAKLPPRSACWRPRTRAYTRLRQASCTRPVRGRVFLAMPPHRRRAAARYVGPRNYSRMRHSARPCLVLRALLPVPVAHRCYLIRHNHLQASPFLLAAALTHLFHNVYANTTAVLIPTPCSTSPAPSIQARATAQLE